MRKILVSPSRGAVPMTVVPLQSLRSCSEVVGLNEKSNTRSSSKTSFSLQGRLQGAVLFASSRLALRFIIALGVLGMCIRETGAPRAAEQTQSQIPSAIYPELMYLLNTDSVTERNIKALRGASTTGNLTWTGSTSLVGIGGYSMEIVYSKPAIDRAEVHEADHPALIDIGSLSSFPPSYQSTFLVRLQPTFLVKPKDPKKHGRPLRPFGPPNPDLFRNHKDDRMPMAARTSGPSEIPKPQKPRPRPAEINTTILDATILDRKTSSNKMIDEDEDTSPLVCIE